MAIRDFIGAAERLKTIMGHVTYQCRKCGLSYDRFRNARDCCYRRASTSDDKVRIAGEKERKHDI